VGNTVVAGAASHPWTGWFVYLVFADLFGLPSPLPLRNIMKFMLCAVGLMIVTLTAVTGCRDNVAAVIVPEPVQPQPQLQIFNGSNQIIDIFWLESDTVRKSNGSVEPGKNTVISSTLGHRFEIVGRNDKATMVTTCDIPIKATRFAPQDQDGIPAFYTQRVSANGFPIVASAKVNPYALKEAVFLVDLMLANRPDVRTAMIKSGARMCMLAYDQYTTDLPEFEHMKNEKVEGFETLSPKDFWDARARGLGGSETDPYCSVAEENLLCYPGDPYALESILIHEFAHSMHLRGMLNVDPTFDVRLKATYDAAMKAGLWKGKYASVNHYEYWAEGVQSWFDNNRIGSTVLKYTKPPTRLTGHMTGYDPAKAPTFEWPERLRSVKTTILESKQKRNEEANGR
jgi:hypothetical protein